MNKVFKIKYSVVKQEMIVVSELANNKDKTASQSNNHKQPLFFSFLPKLKPLSLFIGTILSASLLFSPSAFGRSVEMISGKVGSYSWLGNQGASSIALNPSSASSDTNGQTAEDSVAIGTEATTASATGSIAIGRRAKNEGSAVNSIAIGYGAKNESTASNSVTIARGAINRFEKSIVIGLNAYTQLDPRTTNKETRQGSVVIGENAKSAGNQSVSLGQNAWSKTNSISIGAGTFAEGKSTIAMGSDKISGTKYNDQLPDTPWNGTGTPPANSIWDIFSDLYMGRKNTNTDYNASDRDPNKPEAFYTYSDFKTRYVDNPSASPTYAGKLGAIALGSRTIAAGEMSTAVGSLAFALADKSTAMGLRSFVARGAEGGTAIGEESRTFAENSVAIGNKTEASNAGSMAYGYKAKAVGAGAIAIGAEVAAGAQFDSRQAGNLLLNNGAYAILKNADKSDDTKAENAITAFTQSFDNVLTNGLPLTAGNDTYLTTSAGAIKKTLATTQDGGKNAIAIGNKTFASKANSVALGSYALADAKNAFALGSYSFVEPSATNTIAIGVGSYAKGASSFLGGSWASTLSDRTVVLGHSASISSGSRDALAMGVNAFIGRDSASSLALGMGSTIAKNAKSPDSLAIGKDTRIDAKDTDNGTLYQPQVYDETTRAFRNFNEGSDYMRQAMALGFNAKVSRGAGKMETGINAMAIGAFAQATLQNSTALGVNSKTDYTWEQLEAEPWVSKGATSIPTSGKTGVISVGSKGSERRIVNVASGSFDTDAVNVAQLKTIEERFQSEIDLLQNGGGVQYLSVEKTNVNGEAGRVASQIRKGESYERYVKLKTQLLYLDAREKLNGEKFNQTSLNKIRAAVQELEVEYGGELKTTASELNKVATQLNGETTANNFEKFNQYKTQIENATNADSAKNVGGLTPEVIAQLKANNNYLNDGAKGQDSIAFGWQAKTSGDNNGLAGKQAIAIGFQANSSAENAISIGTNSNTSIAGAVAIGKGARVTEGGKPSIALGQDSTVANSAISSTSSATINGLTFNNFAGSPETLGVLSIGTAGTERKIVNVAAGDISQASTEAINGSQLYATNFMLSKVAKSVKENFGGNANLGPDGTITFTDIGGTGQATIHDAINNVRTKGIYLKADQNDPNGNGQKVELGNAITLSATEQWVNSGVNYKTSNLSTYNARNGSILFGMREDPSVKQITAGTYNTTGDANNKNQLNNILQQTTLGATGITSRVGSTNYAGFSLGADSVTFSKGGAGTVKLSGVSDATADTDAATLKQVKEYRTKLVGDNDITAADRSGGTSNGITYNLSLNKGTVSATEEKVVSGKTVYEAIKSAKPTVSAEANKGIKVTGTKSNDITGNTFTIGLDDATLNKINNAANQDLSNLSENGKNAITGLVDVVKKTDSPITVESSTDNNKKKTFTVGVDFTDTITEGNTADDKKLTTAKSVETYVTNKLANFSTDILLSDGRSGDATTPNDGVGKRSLSNGFTIKSENFTLGSKQYNGSDSLGVMYDDQNGVFKLSLNMTALTTSLASTFAKLDASNLTDDGNKQKWRTALNVYSKTEADAEIQKSKVTLTPNSGLISATKQAGSGNNGDTWTLAVNSTNTIGNTADGSKLVTDKAVKDYVAGTSILLTQGDNDKSNSSGRVDLSQQQILGVFGNDDITTNATGTKIDLTLNKATTVAQNDNKAVTSSAVYSAIESAKPTVSAKQGESILKVEGTKTGGITGDTFKLSLDQTALKSALATDFAKVDASNVAGNAEKWRQAIDVYSKSETNNAIKSSKVTLTPQNGLISATKTTTGTGNQGDTWTLAVNSTDSIDKNNATGGKLVTDKAVKDYVAQSSILRTKGNNATADGPATGQVDLSANQILTVEGVNNGADISTNATGNNISLTLNKATSITNSDSKAATSQAVYDAIKTAKASITAATGDIITVSGTKGDNINSDSWTIGVNYTSDNQIGSNPTGNKLATDLAVKNAVDGAVDKVKTLRIAGDASSSGQVDLSQNQILGITGTKNQIETTAQGNNITLKLSNTLMSKIDGKVDSTDYQNATNITASKWQEALSIAYKANSDTQKTVSLAKGLAFTNGTNTTAEVGDEGVVKFNLNKDLTGITSIEGESGKAKLTFGDALTLNDKKLTGLADGTISTGSKDAITGGQLSALLGADPTSSNTFTNFGGVTGATTVQAAIQTLNTNLSKGYKVKADKDVNSPPVAGTEHKLDLGTTLNVLTDATPWGETNGAMYSGENLQTSFNGTNNLYIGLKEKPTFKELTISNGTNTGSPQSIVFDTLGVKGTFGGSKTTGFEIGDGKILFKQAGGSTETVQLKNVADGVDDNDAVNFKQHKDLESLSNTGKKVIQDQVNVQKADNQNFITVQQENGTDGANPKTYKVGLNTASKDDLNSGTGLTDKIATADATKNYVDEKVNGLSQNLSLTDGTANESLNLKAEKLAVVGTANQTTVALTKDEAQKTKTLKVGLAEDIQGVNSITFKESGQAPNNITGKMSSEGLTFKKGTDTDGSTTTFAEDGLTIDSKANSAQTNLVKVSREGFSVKDNTGESKLAPTKLSIGAENAEHVEVTKSGIALKENSTTGKSSITLAQDAITLAGNATGTAIKLTGVADGAITTASKDAINGGQLRDILGFDPTSKQNTAGQGIGGTGSKTIEGAVKEIKDSVTGAKLKYTANSGTQKQEVLLSDGLDFKNGDNTTATVAASGEVKFSVNKTLEGMNTVEFDQQNGVGDKAQLNASGLVFAADPTNTTAGNSTKFASDGVTLVKNGTTVKLANDGFGIQNGTSQSKLGADKLTIGNPAAQHTVLENGTFARYNGQTKGTNIALSDDAITVSNGTGNIRVTGVANATGDNDAVNFGQYKDLQNVTDKAKKLIQDQIVVTNKDNFVSVSAENDQDGTNPKTYKVGVNTVTDLTNGGTLTDKIATADATKNYVDQKVKGLSQTLDLSDGTTDKSLDLKSEKLKVVGTEKQTSVVLTDNDAASPKEKILTVGLVKDIEGVNSITFDKSGQDPNQVTGRMSSAGLTFKKGDTTNGSTTTFAEDGLTIDSTTNSAQTNLVKVSRDGFSVKNGSDESKLAPTKLSIGAENSEHVEVTKTGIALKANDTTGKSSITLSDSAITLAAATAGDAIKLTGVADGEITANSKDAVNGGQLHDVLGFDPKDKQNTAGQGIGGTGSKTIEGAISEVKESLTNATLAYKANGANDKTVKLTEGLNFTNTTNIDASVEDNGVVKFTLKENLTGLKNIATESLNASKNIIAGGTVTVGGETEGIVLTKSGSGNDRTLSLSGAGNAATDGIKVSGVKAGEAETDAVNKGQLDKLSKAINDALGTTDLAVTKDPNKTSIFDPINGTAPTTFKDAVDKLTTAVNTGWGLKVDSTNKNIGAGKTVTVAGSNGITANLSNDDSPTLTIGLTTTEFNTDNPATISAKQTGNTFATAENVASAINAATAGLSQTLKFKANGDTSDQSLNLKTQTLEFNKDNNLTVSSTGTSITYGLSNNITLGDSTNAGQITIKRGAGSNHDLVIGKDGKITGLANGSIATNSTDAVNGGQIRSILGVDPNNAIGGTSKTNISEAIKEVKDKADKLAATNLHYKATNSQGTTKQNSQTPAQEQKGEVSLTTGLDFRDGKNTTSEVSDNGVVKYHLNETLDDMDTINFKAQPNQTNKAKLNADGLVIADDPNNISTGNYTALGKDGVTLVKGDSTVKLADEGFSVKNATSESKLGADKLTLGKTGENHLEITKDAISAKNGSNGKSGINFTENTVTLVGKDGTNGTNSTAKLTGLSDGAIGADSKDAINGKQIYDVLGFDPATKKNEAGQGIGGTSSKTVDGAIKEVKDSVTNATLKYTANSATKKEVKLSEGLNFINGDNTTASVEDNGKVKVSVNTTLKDMDTINFKAKTNDKAALSSGGLVFDDSTTAAQTNRTTFAKDGVTLEKDGSTVKVAKDGFAVKDATSQSKVESNKLSVGDVAGNAFGDHLEVSKTGISRLGGTEENLVSLTLGNKAVTLAGKDSAAVALKGVSSALGLTAGATAVEKATAQSKMTDLLAKTNGDLNTAVNLADLQAVAQAGLDFAGNSGELHRTLGSKLNVKGEGNVTGTTAADNITVEASTDTLTIKLSNNITNISSIGGGKKTNPNTEEKAKITFEDDSLKVNDKTLTGVKSALDNVQVPSGSNPPTTLEKLAEAAKDKVNGGASSVVNVKDLSDVATALTDKGLSFVGDDSQQVDRKLGQTLKLIGGANKDQLSDGNNIGVTKDTTDGTLKLRLAKDLSQIASIAFDTAGGVTGKISSEGTVFTKGDKNNGGETKTTFGVDGVTIDNTKTAADGTDAKTTLVKVATDGFSVTDGNSESKLGADKLTIGKSGEDHLEISKDTITAKNGTDGKSSIKLAENTVTLVGKDGNNATAKLTGVADGSMAAGSNDAVNGGQINKILGFDPAELEKPNGSKTGIGGTSSKTVDGAIEEVKNSVVNAELTYRANDETDDQAKKVKLSKGLSFKNGTNTTATVGDDGVVTYSLNATLNEMDTINFATKNNNNATLNSDGLVFNSEPNDANHTTFAKDGVTLTKAASDGTVSTIKVAEDGFSVKAVDNTSAVQNESKLGADKLTIGTPTADHFEVSKTGISRLGGEDKNTVSLTLGENAVTLAGKDSAAVALKGVSSALGLSATTVSKDDAKTKVEELLKKNNTELNTAVNLADLQAVAQSGFDFAGNSGNEIHRTLGTKLTIKGEGTLNGDTAADNLTVVSDGTDTLTVKLSKNLTNINSIGGGNTAAGAEKAKITFEDDKLKVNDKTLTGVKSALDSVQVMDGNTPKQNPTILEKLDTAAKDTQGGSSSVVNVKDLSDVATALTDKGLSFVGDDSQKVDRKLGETLKLIGGANKDQLSDGNNIGVTKDTTDGTLKLRLAKELSQIASIAFDTVGGVTGKISSEGTIFTKGDKNNGGETKTTFGVDGVTIDNTKTAADGTDAKTTLVKVATDGFSVTDGNSESKLGADKLTIGTPTADHLEVSKTGISRLGGADKDIVSMTLGENAVTLAGKDSAAVALKGVSSALGLSATTVSKGDAKTKVEDLLKKNNTELNTAVNLADLQAVAQSGFDFAGNSGNEIHRTLGTKLTIKGEGTLTGDTAADNLTVVSDGTDTLTVKLSKNLTNINSIGGGTATSGTGEKAKITFEDDKLKVNDKTLTGVKSALDGVQVMDGNTPKQNPTILEKLDTAAKDTQGGSSSVVNVKDLSDVATALTDKGLSFVGDDSQKVDRKLGETLKLTGGASTNLSDGANIGVTKDTADGTLKLRLAKALSQIASVAFDPTASGVTGKISSEGTVFTKGDKANGGETTTTFGIDGVTIDNTKTVDGADVKTNLVKVATDGFSVKQGENESKLSPTKLSIGKETGSHIEVTNEGIALKENAADKSSIKLGTDAITLAGNAANQPIKLTGVANGSMAANSNDAVNGGQINKILGFDPADFDKQTDPKTGIGGTNAKTIEGAISALNNKKLKYIASGANGTQRGNDQEVDITNGLNFKDGKNTTASVDANGVVQYALNDTLEEMDTINFAQQGGTGDKAKLNANGLVFAADPNNIQTGDATVFAKDGVTLTKAATDGTVSTIKVAEDGFSVKKVDGQGSVQNESKLGADKLTIGTPTADHFEATNTGIARKNGTANISSIELGTDAITLAGANATDGITLKGVKGGEISSTSKEAINGTQLNDLGATVLGATVKDDKTGFVAPDFAAINGKKDKPTTFKAAIDQLIEGMNSGINLKGSNSTDAHKALLGSTITIKQDNYTDDNGTQYKGENLSVTLDNNSQTFTVAMKKDPRFDTVKVGTDGENQLVINGSEISSKVKGADGAVSDGAKVTLGKDEITLSKGTGSDPVELKGVASAIDKITKVTKDDGTENSNPTVLEKLEQAAKDGASSVVNVKDLNNVAKAVQDSLTEKGLTFADDNGTEVKRKLGETLTVKGGVQETQDPNAEKKLTDNNIGVVSDTATNALVVKLAKEISDITSIATNTAGSSKSVFDTEGVTVTGLNQDNSNGQSQPTETGAKASYGLNGVSVKDTEGNTSTTNATTTQFVDKEGKTSMQTASGVVTVDGTHTSVLKADSMTMADQNGHSQLTANELSLIDNDGNNNIQTAAGTRLTSKDGDITAVTGKGIMSISPDSTKTVSLSSEGISLNSPNGGVNVTSEGFGFTGVNNQFRTDAPRILATGIDAGNKKISNVADGDISPTSGDVVTGRQLYALMQKGIRVYGDEVSPTKTQTTAPTNANPTATTAPTASSTQGGATTANAAGGVAPAGNVATGDIAPTQPTLPEMNTALVDEHLAVPLGGSLKIHGDHNVKTTISADNQVGISLQPNISIENNLVIGSNDPEKAKLAAQEGNALVITNKDDGNSAMVFNNEKNMLVLSDKEAKPRAVLDGQNGALTLVGNDDSQVTLSSKKGKDIDGNDLSRLSVMTERTNANGQLEKVETSFATMDDGLKFKADGDKAINKKLNETVEIVGDENVTTSITDDKKVKVSLNKKIAIDEVKIPNTDPDAQEGDSIVINNGGIHAGNKVITGVKASDDPTSAVNRGQLNTVIDNVQNNFNQVNQRIGDLTRESRAGIAGAMATASLQNVVLPGKTTISVGTATFKGENAVAIGMSRLSDNGKVGIRLSGMSTSNGDKGAAMSVGFTF
ncbi:YadA-like family protein [Avibacterium paragallinarum]|uniref:YadA-like family protein n=1 Tax=Avibacterium paragallinarum TaxID=728 RepID=UPI003978F0B9